MRTRVAWLLLAVAVSLAAIEEPRAYLRVTDAGNPSTYYIEIGVPRTLAVALPYPEAIQVTVYEKNRRQVPAVVVPSASGDRSHFRLDLPNGFAPESDGTDLAVAIRDFVADDKSANGWIVPVTTEIQASLQIDEFCAEYHMGPYSVAFSQQSEFKDGYARKRLAALIGQMQSSRLESIGRLRVERLDRDQVEPRPIRNFRLTPNTGLLCLETEGAPKSAKYDVEFAFVGVRPFEIPKPLLLTNQTGASTEAAIRAAQDKNAVGARTLERNVDAAVLLSSAPADVTKGNATVRERQTQGTLDLRFAPILNWQATPAKKLHKPIWWWTPFLVDAKVSTGNITKDTLALNRIVAGTEGEMRWYYNTKRSPDFTRHILRLVNASDRDFKQAEAKLNYEFQPVLSFLNRPLAYRTKAFPYQLDPKRGQKLIVNPGRIGWSLIPVAGGELGRTYTQRSPAVPFPGDKTVRRVYAGGQLVLNLTAYLRINAAERIYARGEAAGRDLGHNYFNGEIEIPLGGLSNYAGQSFFFSFERGGQPPFATPDVNAIKLGYRLTSNGWLGRLR